MHPSWEFGGASGATLSQHCSLSNAVACTALDLHWRALNQQHSCSTQLRRSAGAQLACLQHALQARLDLACLLVSYSTLAVARVVWQIGRKGSVNRRFRALHSWQKSPEGLVWAAGAWEAL